MLMKLFFSFVLMVVGTGLLMCAGGYTVSVINGEYSVDTLWGVFFLMLFGILCLKGSGWVDRSKDDTWKGWTW